MDLIATRWNNINNVAFRTEKTWGGKSDMKSAELLNRKNCGRDVEF